MPAWQSGLSDLPSRSLTAKKMQSIGQHQTSATDSEEWNDVSDSSGSLSLGAAIPKKTRTARFSRTMSSSARRPTRVPIFDFRTLVILSTISRQAARSPVLFVGLDRQPKQRSIGWGRKLKAHMVIESVMSKPVVLKNRNRTGLPGIILAARNGPNFTALHTAPQSETASMKSWSSLA